MNSIQYMFYKSNKMHSRPSLFHTLLSRKEDCVDDSDNSAVLLCVFASILVYQL